MLHPMTIHTAWLEILLTRFLSPLPTALAIRANTPIPMAWGTLFTSHVTVVLTLTDAVACPPTIAVSTYWISVASTSSIIVGIDNVTSIYNTLPHRSFF